MRPNHEVLSPNAVPIRTAESTGHRALGPDDAQARIRQVDRCQVANHPCTVAYPLRLYDLVMELAYANVQVLVGAGDNLHATLAVHETT